MPVREWTVVYRSFGNNIIIRINGRLPVHVPELMSQSERKDTPMKNGCATVRVIASTEFTIGTNSIGDLDFHVATTATSSQSRVFAFAEPWSPLQPRIRN